MDIDTNKELQKEIEGMSLSRDSVYFRNWFHPGESGKSKSTWMDMAKTKYTTSHH